MVERAELIPDLPNLSALIDRRSPRKVTQVLGDYEASRAVYALHAETLRNAILEKQAAERAIERLEPRREQLREATRSLGKLDDKVSGLRGTIPISEIEVERTFIRAEENFQRVCTAFEMNAVRFGKEALDQAQLRISAGRASLDQYAFERSPGSLAAHRLVMDALAQPHPGLQPQRLQVAENAPPTRTGMLSGLGAALRNAVPRKWRRPPEPQFEMVTPPLEPSRGRQQRKLRNYRNSLTLERTQAIKPQQRPGTQARSSAENAPTRKPGPKISL